MRMVSPRFAACVVAVCLLGTTAYSLRPFSPPQSGIQFRSSAARLPLAADGSREPWKIPDRVAHNHFILSAAKGQSPSPHDRRRRDSIMDRLRLTGEDRANFVKALEGVRESLDAIKDARSKRAPGILQEELATLKAQEQRVLTEAWWRVSKALSPAAGKRVDNYVKAYVKSRIKIYGTVVE